MTAPATIETDTAAELAARAAAIKAAGKRGGALLVGIAPVEAFNEHVPEGHRPQDILPGAKSVVVAGNQGPTAGAWHSPDHRVMEITGYDFRENVAVHVMCDHIEHEYGYKAIQAPSLPTAGHHPPMSMMLAAVLAGLGTRSLAANIILNPDYGLLYYAALITTLPLESDQKLEKDACPSPYCIQMFKKLGTTPCLASCPKDAGRLPRRLDRRQRPHRLLVLQPRALPRALDELRHRQHAEEPGRHPRRGGPRAAQAMIYSDFFTQSIGALTYYKESVAQCFECMRVCPVGQNTKRLK